MTTLTPLNVAPRASTIVEEAANAEQSMRGIFKAKLSGLKGAERIAGIFVLSSIADDHDFRLANDATLSSRLPQRIAPEAKRWLSELTKRSFSRRPMSGALVAILKDAVRSLADHLELHGKPADRVSYQTLAAAELALDGSNGASPNLTRATAHFSASDRMALLSSIGHAPTSDLMQQCWHGMLDEARSKSAGEAIGALESLLSRTWVEGVGSMPAVVIAAARAALDANVTADRTAPVRLMERLGKLTCAGQDERGALVVHDRTRVWTLDANLTLRRVDIPNTQSVWVGPNQYAPVPVPLESVALSMDARFLRATYRVEEPTFLPTYLDTVATVELAVGTVHTGWKAVQANGFGDELAGGSRDAQVPKEAEQDYAARPPTNWREVLVTSLDAASRAKLSMAIDAATRG